MYRKYKSGKFTKNITPKIKLFEDKDPKLKVINKRTIKVGINYNNKNYKFDYISDYNDYYDEN